MASELPWYIRYTPKLPGIYYVNSSYSHRVKDLSWYLDIDVNMNIYEKLLPSPLLGNKRYDIDPLACFNKLYFVMNKIILYSDNSIFIRDYLAAFAVNDFVHIDISERIFFFGSLLKIVRYFQTELFLPPSCINTIKAIIADLKLSLEDQNTVYQSDENIKSEKISNDSSPFRANYGMKADKTKSNPISSGVDGIRQSMKIRKTIVDKFEEIEPNEGWRYAFRSEDDLKLIVDLLVSHFSNQNEKELPTDTINLKLNTKTRIAMCIRSIHQEVGSGELRNQKDLYNIIRCMNHFKTDDDAKIYKLMHK